MTTTLPTWLSRALNLLGIVVVAATVWRQSPSVPPWIGILVALALVGWGCLALLRDRAPVVLLLATAVAGAITTVPTDGVAIVPVIVAMIVTIGAPARPAWQAVVVVLASVVVVPAGLIVASIHPLALLSIEGGLAVAAIGGFTRRQARIAQLRERELLEQRARGAALAERQAVARDIHDVLAHSLGGLVIQLDAIDAQLEAGRVTDAATRVRQARELAASGLTEARRAVDALRDERVGIVDATAVELSITQLVDAHRMLGGVAELTQIGSARDLQAERADGLRRALQESLTNARKHAAGQPVAIVLRWVDDSGARVIDLDVSNPLPDSVTVDAGAGGHGLRGMAERVSRFGGATAGVVAGRFVVHVRVDE